MSPFESLALPHLSTTLKEFEDYLPTCIRTDNPGIKQPALRVITGGGKRLRPALIIASASGGRIKSREKLLASCAAIELAHTATLVHDDIIDNAQTRWQIPTISAKEGEDTAIVVGDYLLSIAQVEASKASPEAASLLAATIATVCDGQAQEMRSEFNIHRTVDDYLETIHKKTAALLSAACQLGGIAANFPKEKLDALRLFGEAFGMAYQIIDDMLDFLSDEQSLGKPVGNDVKEGVYTLPLLLALHKPPGDLQKTLEHRDVSGKDILGAIQKTDALFQTMKTIESYNQKAAEALKPFNAPKLAEFPSAYFRWALKKQSVIDVI